MPEIIIDETGCRGCQLCVEICPTSVLEMDGAAERATVARGEDCIGCTSCMYICPSRCLEVSDYLVQRPFYRIERDASLVARFLQKTPAAAALEEGDYEEALRDVSTRLLALVTSTADTLGRGQKAFGRRAGQLAASHLPEMYEEASPSAVFARLQERLTSSFAFTLQSPADESREVRLSFHGCALRKVVERAGGRVGEAALCIVFHDYLAGLLGEFTGIRYAAEISSVRETCDVVFVEHRAKG